jgi:hypothetical protein
LAEHRADSQEAAVAEPHEETAFPKPKNCRQCGNPLGAGADRCDVCNQKVTEVAEPRSVLVIALIVTAVVLVGVLVAIWAVNST